MALQEDNDETGDVISVNGAPTDEAGEKDDRGDVIEPGEPDVTVEPEESAEPPKDEHKPQHIPKSRFDEVNNKKNELAEQLLEAQSLIEALRAKPAAPTAQPAVFDEDAQEQAYIDALLDGNADKAKAIRREINTYLREQVAQQVEERGNQRQAVATLQQASAQAVADFPYLDTDDGAEALELIIASRDAKIARGMTPAEALRTAVATIAPRFAPETASPPLGVAAKEPFKDTRTAAALARGAADSNLQPPSVQAGVGNRATASRVNVSEMTEEQFESLSPAEKKRLRGDQ